MCIEYQTSCLTSHQRSCGYKCISQHSYLSPHQHSPSAATSCSVIDFRTEVHREWKLVCAYRNLQGTSNNRLLRNESIFEFFSQQNLHQRQKGVLVWIAMGQSRDRIHYVDIHVFVTSENNILFLWSKECGLYSSIKLSMSFCCWQTCTPWDVHLQKFVNFC